MNALRKTTAILHRNVGRRFSSTFGVVFDVDGVLLRGKTPIPGAREVLLELEATNTPFAIMTNGGGYPEDKKARQIEQILGGGVSVPTERMCMSHTPMRELAHKHRDELVLAVGKDCAEIRKVMANYGFNHVITVDQLHRHFPPMYPDVKVQDPLNHDGRFDSQPFAAIFVLIDPIYWGRELQITMDVLWKSVLTLTGMHVGPENHEEHPAYEVVDDVAQALAFIKEDFAKMQAEKK
ncbi:hypothetical protein AM588_10001098 [Phytophthora nicotianae]|uniref:Uncharacterized protein n=1 Tax=Phytophthora nicotianae TaxID=4792 RepID=A0A0W8CKV3_PHYNI|nr:hypothetical protein AM588_10001098 [Phytophthora nicotianae]